MVGTKVKKKGRDGERFTIAGAAGGAWVLQPEVFSTSPVTVGIAELSESFVVEDGAKIEAPADAEQIERDAWQRLGRIKPAPAPREPEQSVTEAFDDLAGRRKARGAFRATAEDTFTLLHPPSTEGPSQARIDTATANIAHDLVRLHGREAIQSGEVSGVDPRVLRAVRELITKGDR